MAAQLLELYILGLAKAKTRILVTHHLDVAKHADHIIVMDKGRIAQQGSYTSLSRQDGIFQALLQEYSDMSAFSKDLSSSVHVEAAKHSSMHNTAVKELHLKEERSRGDVSVLTYAAYIRAMGAGPHLVAAALCMCLGQCAQVGTTVFLGLWSGNVVEGFNQNHYMGIYSGLGVAMATLVFLTHYSLCLGALRAAWIMFQGALHGVLRSPVEFHDRTPTGRIMSRFTNDVSTIDDNMGSLWAFFLSQFLSVFGTFGLIFYIYSYLGFLIIPLGLSYYILALFYRQTFREVTPFSAVARSFLFSHFGEQLTGISSIRTFGQHGRFVNRLANSLNNECRFHFANIAAERWFCLRLDVLGSLLLFGVAIFGVCARSRVAPEKFGVVLTYALQTTMLLGEMMIRYAGVESGK